MNISKEELQNVVESLSSNVAAIRNATDELKEAKEVVNKKLEEKYLPVNLEADILKSVQTSIHESIKTVLSGYDSPLKKLVFKVVDEYNQELKSLISESFAAVIRTEDFKRSILDGFSHKIARSIISNNNGLFDKVSNELKQDQTFKAKMILAVANVVNECLKEGEKK